MINATIPKEQMDKIMKRLQHIERNLGGGARTPVGDLINFTALRIETGAKKQITADNHVVTGRLRSSIHAKLKPTETFIYNDGTGRVYGGSLEAGVQDGKEAVVGTNVVYAEKIEHTDSYLLKACQDEAPELAKRLKKLAEKIVGGKTPDISMG